MPKSLSSRLLKFCLIFQRHRSPKHIRVDHATCDNEWEVNRDQNDNNNVLDVDEVKTTSSGDDDEVGFEIDENFNSHPKW